MRQLTDLLKLFHMEDQKASIKDFQRIPGVGKAVALDLWNLGYREVRELAIEDPQGMYNRLCELQKTKVDICMLYTFRCAVYFARTADPDPELLKWWNWKNKEL